MNVSLSDIPDNLKLDAMRRDGARRAIDKVLDALESDLARAKKNWEKQLSDATKAYREHMRDEARAGLDVDALREMLASGNVPAKQAPMVLEVVGLYLQACEGLDERDKIDADKKADLKAKTTQIGRFNAALEDMGSADIEDGAQGKLPLGEAAKPWACADAQEVAFTALTKLSADGKPLCAIQQALLLELANAGLEAFDLGIAAAEAVETNTDEEAEDDEQDSDATPDISQIFNRPRTTH